MQTLISSLHAPAGLRLGYRRIEDNDASFLLAEERGSIGARTVDCLCQSGAARAIAHDLLHQLGATQVAVPRGAHGAPVWPLGFIGSLAHDETMAFGAVAPSGQTLRSVGVDIEAAEPLPAELADMVRAPGDVTSSVSDDLATRVLFAAKEAVFKAAFPLDRQVLGFEHIAVDLARGSARTPGRSDIHLRIARGSHILALAYIYRGSDTVA